MGIHQNARTTPLSRAGQVMRVRAGELSPVGLQQVVLGKRLSSIMVRAAHDDSPGRVTRGERVCKNLFFVALWPAVPRQLTCLVYIARSK